MKIKKLLIIFLVLAFVFTIAACDESKDEYVYPNVSNPDSAIELNSDYSVTKGLTYKMIKAYGGIDLLEEYIDSLILSDKVSEIISKKDSDYKTKLENKETELKADMTDDEYKAVLTLAGYTYVESYKYLALLVARDEVVYNFLKTEVDKYTSTYYTKDSDYETYYNNNKYEIFGDSLTAKAIITNYFTQADYINDLKTLGYVYYNNQIRDLKSEYNALTLSERQYSEDKMDAISNYKDVFKALYKEHTGVDYEEADINYTSLKDNALAIAKALYEMNDGEYTNLATSKSTTLSTFYVTIYKISGSMLPSSYKDLTSDQKAQVKEAYIKNKMESSQDKILAEIRDDNKLKFVDRDYLYKYDGSTDDNLKGDKSVIFKLKGTEYSADSFYAYVETRNIDYYKVLAAIAQVASNTDTYKDLYCEASKRKETHSSTIDEKLKDCDEDETTLQKGFELYTNGYMFNSIDDNLTYDLMNDDYLFSLVIDELFSKTEATHKRYETATDEDKTEQNNPDLEIIERTFTVDEYTLKEAYKTYFESVIEEHNVINSIDNVEKVENYNYGSVIRISFKVDTDGDYKANATEDWEVKDSNIGNAVKDLFKVFEKIAELNTENGTSSTATSEFLTKAQTFINYYNNGQIDKMGTDLGAVQAQTAATQARKLGIIIKLNNDSTVKSTTTSNNYNDQIKTQIQALYDSATTDKIYVWDEYDSIDINDEDEEITFIYYKLLGYKSMDADSSSYQPSFKYIDNNTNKSSSSYSSTAISSPFYNEKNKMTLEQLVNMSVVTMYNNLLTSSDEAKEAGITEYPTSIPSHFSSDHYSVYTADIVSNYMTNTNFAYAVVAKRLSTDSNDSFAKLANALLTSVK